MKRWRIDYYGSGCFIYTKYIDAKTREDALKQLWNSGKKVIEIYRCTCIG